MDFLFLFFLVGLYLFVAGIFSWVLFLIARESPREFFLPNAKKWILWFFVVMFLPFPVYSFLCGGFLSIGENLLGNASDIGGGNIQGWIFFLSTSMAYFVLSYASVGFIYSILRRVSKGGYVTWASIFLVCALMVIVDLSTRNFQGVSC